MSAPTATIHLVRHGHVHNPTGVIYGRLPEFHLSDIGRAMAERLGSHFESIPLAHLRCSPLVRAQETMAPIAERHPGVQVHTDPRVIESDNNLEGKVVSLRTIATHPNWWWLFRNPLKPTWGESYAAIAARMQSAIAEAAETAYELAGTGGQALILSHQQPIWIARRAAEGRSFPHDPRRRQCSLASITSLNLIKGRIVSVRYFEPAFDLLPAESARPQRTFRAGA